MPQLTNQPPTVFEVRRGAYYDSIILMQLQKALAGLPGVVDAGVVMATPANKDLLQANDFSIDHIDAKPDDLLIIIKGESEAAANDALGQVDELLKQKRSSGAATAYRPKSLAAAAKTAPDAGWVLISVPGRFAAGVADEALDLGKHVFLYSDNVPVEKEIELKEKAAHKGVLLMGPDCGTAIVNGVGLGFANRVRRGRIGIVAASGTGLQAVSVGIHNRGGGVSQALGTGGRDLKSGVEGRTAFQAIVALGQDPHTDVITLISKPPDPALVARLMRALQATGKPAVVFLLGQAAPGRQLGDIHFALSLDHAAELAVNLSQNQPAKSPAPDPLTAPFVRGLFSGGTLASEMVLALQAFLQPLWSNVPFRPEQRLDDVWHSRDHTIIDMGEDAFTQGRLHPMLDHDLRLRRLKQEAEDEQVGLIILDVVLGEGSHPDPAAELAPAVAAVKEKRPDLQIACLIVATPDDPQDIAAQIEQLEAAGAVVTRTVDALADAIFAQTRPSPEKSKAITLSGDDLAAINVGIETFYDSLNDQGADVIQVDWRPPAGGNEKMMALLAKMKKSS